jgi:hypothetical protein
MQEVRGSTPLSSTRFLDRSEGVSLQCGRPLFSIFNAWREPDGGQPSCGLGFLLRAKDGIHGRRALGDHRADLMAVDPGGDRRVLVPYQVSDGLDREAVVAPKTPAASRSSACCFRSARSASAAISGVRWSGVPSRSWCHRPRGPSATHRSRTECERNRPP